MRRRISLRIISILLVLAGLVVVGGGLYIGAGQGKTLGGMVLLLVGLVVGIEGAFLIEEQPLFSM